MNRLLSVLLFVFLLVPFAQAQRSQDENRSSHSSSPITAGTRKVWMVDGIEYAFRWCPPGEFMMGGGNLPFEERPVHKVKLTQGFWLLETEVTQEMWQSVMGENPSEFKSAKNPVECVSWDDCQSFCQKLGQKLGQKVQLPTEAQWEYACRAGTTGEFAGDLDSMGWYYSNTGKLKSTKEVAQKKPNAWGLYDMHGNVMEWCSDYFDDEYYARSPMSDPENTTESPYRVLRGGCWLLFSECLGSAFRGKCPAGRRQADKGLRPVLVPSSVE